MARFAAPLAAVLAAECHRPSAPNHLQLRPTSWPVTAGRYLPLHASHDLRHRLRARAPSPHPRPPFSLTAKRERVSMITPPRCMLCLLSSHNVQTQLPRCRPLPIGLFQLHSGRTGKGWPGSSETTRTAPLSSSPTSLLRSSLAVRALAGVLHRSEARTYWCLYIASTVLVQPHAPRLIEHTAHVCVDGGDRSEAEQTMLPVGKQQLGRHGGVERLNVAHWRGKAREGPCTVHAPMLGWRARPCGLLTSQDSLLTAHSAEG